MTPQEHEGARMDGGAETTVQNDDPIRVVICGAGPAGLLLAHYLLSFGGSKFRIVMYDKAEDPRETLKQELSYRRFTIGISRRGENSIKLVPGLLQKVKNVTHAVDCFAMLPPLMKKPIVAKRNMAKTTSNKSFLVDRFSLCASLMQALDDLHSSKRAEGLLATHFGCPCVGVDLLSQQATFQAQSKGSAPVVENYDLLVGADGLRSVVRSAFQHQIRNFEVETKLLPGSWAVTHFPCPEGYSKGTFHMLSSVPNSRGIGGLAMPAPDGSLCFIWGWDLGNIPEGWLACTTPKEAHDFIHSRLPYFNITEEAAWKLRSGPMQTSMHVKCWRYHDERGHAVLIGDAAHCTAPNIGQGCNASLVDACVLARLLLGEVVTEQNRAPEEPLPEEQKRLWAKDPSPASIRAKLPELLTYFSALQVKEGHALVDLSNSCGPISQWAKILHAVCFLVRFFVSILLPFLVLPPVMPYAGNTSTSYSTIYRKFQAETDFFLWANRKFWEQHEAAQATKVLKKDL